MSIAKDTYVSPDNELYDEEPQGEVVLTIVTSALNEAANAPVFLERASAALEALNIPGEILFFDDGSTDGTSEAVAAYAREHFSPPVRLVRHPRCRGLAASINEGAALARGEFVCFVPADLESDPMEDIPKLFLAVDDATDVVLGQRVGRGDRKQLASSVYNRINAVLFGVKFRDGNWIKLVRRDCLEGIELQNDWHPFLAPILAHAGCQIKAVDTAWHPRKHGRSKFGFRRFPIAVAAALSVKFHLAYGSRPLLFFLFAAAIMGTIGLVLGVASFMVTPATPRLWTCLQCFSAASFVAGWLSVMTGLLVDFLADNQSCRVEK